MQRKNMLSLIAIILIAVLTVGAFGSNKNVKAEEDTAAYVFEAAATTQSHIRNGETLEDYDELVYCLEILKPGPNKAYDYKRTLLSDEDIYDADTKSRLMTVLMERDNILGVLDSLGTPEADTYKLYYWRDGASNYVFQHLIWIIVSEDSFLTGRTDEYGYKGIEQAVTQREDYSYSEPDSLWNTVIVPMLNYIDSRKADYPVGKAAGQYDASFYTSDPSIQLLLGRGFKNPVPTPTEAPEVTAAPTPTEVVATPTEAAPTDAPSATTEPTAVPTAEPTTAPSATPAEEPVATSAPSATPTDAPEATPTAAPEATPVIDEDSADTATPTPALDTDKDKEVKATATPTAAPVTPVADNDGSDSDDSEAPAATATPTAAPAVMTPSGNEEATGTDAPSVTTVPSATSVTGTDDASDSDAPAPTATPTATPTAAPTATPTQKPAQNGNSNSNIVQTGESQSASLLIAALALMTSGALLLIRAKKNKED